MVYQHPNLDTVPVYNFNIIMIVFHLRNYDRRLLHITQLFLYFVRYIVQFNIINVIFRINVILT